MIEDGDGAVGEGCLGLFCRFFRAALNLFGAWKGCEDFGRDVLCEACEFCEALLAFGQCLVGVAFFREARAGALASVSQEGVDVSAEECGDIDLHLFPLQVGIVHDFAVDGARFVLREHDGGFGADAGAGGAVGFAVVLVLHLELFLVIHAVHAEETE